MPLEKPSARIAAQSQDLDSLEQNLLMRTEFTPISTKQMIESLSCQMKWKMRARVSLEERPLQFQQHNFLEIIKKMGKENENSLKARGTEDEGIKNDWVLPSLFFPFSGIPLLEESHCELGHLVELLLDTGQVS